MNTDAFQGRGSSGDADMSAVGYSIVGFRLGGYP